MDIFLALDGAHAAVVARDLTRNGPWYGDNQTITTGQVIRAARDAGLELTAAEASAAIDAATGRTLVGAR